MRAGKTVTYVDKKGAADALVVAVVGSGGSGYKTLDLSVGGVTKTAVPHERDKTKHYWTERAVSSEAERFVPAPAVPEPKGAGRATAGVGDTEVADDGGHVG